MTSAMRAAREELTLGEAVVDYRLTVPQAEADPEIRAALNEDPRTLGAASLAQEAGFGVELEAQEWDNGELFFRWHVTGTRDLDAGLMALVWDAPDGQLEYTLTRSTRHPGWQLTSWATDGFPWGHRDLSYATEAFDTDVMASGVPLKGLVQVIFADGRVLVREGAKRITYNPSQALKRRLMQ